MKFDFDKYPGKYVMHCKTEEEAKEFCKVMHDAGRTWFSGTPYLPCTMWDWHNEKTVYYFNEGGYGFTDGPITQNYTILEWSDFRKEKEMTKSELKTGMVVEYRDGEKRIVLRDTPIGDVLICKDRWNSLNSYTDDLRNTTGAPHIDIIAVYTPMEESQMEQENWNAQTCIWRRSEVKEVKEVTIAEIAKKFGVAVEDIRIKEE